MSPPPSGGCYAAARVRDNRWPPPARRCRQVEHVGDVGHPDARVEERPHDLAGDLGALALVRRHERLIQEQQA
jgi:hypothetical protein